MRWSGDDASADVPFVKTVAGKRIAIVPRINFASNDLVVWLRPSHAPSTYFEGFKEAFDWVYREGERGNPLWAELLLHSDMGTRPPLINAFERALTYAKGHSDIWFARRGDLADWALSQSARCGGLRSGTHTGGRWHRTSGHWWSSSLYDTQCTRLFVGHSGEYGSLEYG